MSANDELAKNLLGDTEQQWFPASCEEGVFELCKRPLERFLTCRVYVQRISDDIYKAKDSPGAEPRDGLLVEESQLAYCATSLAKLLNPDSEGDDDEVV